jgi:hypothetical protein
MKIKKDDIWSAVIVTLIIGYFIVMSFLVK